MNQEISQQIYNGPKITAEAAASLYDSSIRSGVEVLDIGAGTGQVAEQVIHLQSIKLQKPHKWCNITVLASYEVDHGFEHRSGQNKDYEIGIRCFSAEEKEKILGIRITYSSLAKYLRAYCCFSIIKIQLIVLVSYKVDIIIISSNVTCSRHGIAKTSSFDVKQQPPTQY